MERLPRLVLLSNFAATMYMVGIVWLIQIVHYPLYSMVGEETFRQYEIHHARFIFWVVGPPMLIELGTAMLLALGLKPRNVATGPLMIGAILVFIAWWSSAFVQSPYHSILGGTGFDQSAYEGLVRTNWIRTVAWSVRGLLMGWIVFRLIPQEATSAAATKQIESSVATLHRTPNAAT